MAAARDLSTLTHVLKRVTENTSHDAAEREQIASHLRSAIATLTRWTITPPQNGHTRKLAPEKSRSRAER